MDHFDNARAWNPVHVDNTGVSYCVYTAATVDAYEMRMSDDEARAEATEKLSAALRVLEDEAKQTPGIRKEFGHDQKAAELVDSNSSGSLECSDAGRFLTAQRGSADRHWN